MTEKNRILRRAYQLSEASRLIHERPDFIRARILGERQFDGCSGFRDFRFIDSAHSKAIICADETDLLIVFGGMKIDSPEFRADLDCRLWRNPLGGMTHDGFSDALDRIFPEIDRVRREFSSSSDPNIWIAGHSFGGALAVLAAADLAYWYPKISIAGIYTFGQPRVGNVTFCRAFNRTFRGRCFRFVTNTDGVPGLIRRWPPNYGDVGQEVYIDSSGTPHFHVPFLNRWIEKIEGFVEGFGNGEPDVMRECGIDHYVSRLACASEHT